MTEHQIRWCEHRAKVGALEDEIALLRVQRMGWNEAAVRERKRAWQLRAALEEIAAADQSEVARIALQVDDERKQQ
jgi:hypothetical protein